MQASPPSPVAGPSLNSTHVVSFGFQLLPVHAVVRVQHTMSDGTLKEEAIDVGTAATKTLLSSMTATAAGETLASILTRMVRQILASYYGVAAANVTVTTSVTDDANAS